MKNRNDMFSRSFAAANIDSCGTVIGEIAMTYFYLWGINTHTCTLTEFVHENTKIHI